MFFKLLFQSLTALGVSWPSNLSTPSWFRGSIDSHEREIDLDIIAVIIDHCRDLLGKVFFLYIMFRISWNCP